MCLFFYFDGKIYCRIKGGYRRKRFPKNNIWICRKFFVTFKDNAYNPQNFDCCALSVTPTARDKPMIATVPVLLSLPKVILRCRRSS